MNCLFLGFRFVCRVLNVVPGKWGYTLVASRLGGLGVFRVKITWFWWMEWLFS